MTKGRTRDRNEIKKKNLCRGLRGSTKRLDCKFKTKKTTMEPSDGLWNSCSEPGHWFSKLITTKDND